MVLTNQGGKMSGIPKPEKPMNDPAVWDNKPKRKIPRPETLPDCIAGDGEPLAPSADQEWGSALKSQVQLNLIQPGAPIVEPAAPPPP